MQIVYAREAFPAAVTRSIFLAGPTPRSPEVPSWRPAAIAALARLGFDGAVFVPEPRGGAWAAGYDEQIAWEEAGLHRADVILFWVPRDMSTLPGLTTNIEWGVWSNSGKVVLGVPEGAAHVGYMLHYAQKHRAPVAHDLDGLAAAAIGLAGPGEHRSEGECEVPLHVWRHPTFRAWYAAQRRAGHRLVAARVLWSYFAGPERRFFFAWALRVTIHIPGEGRNKSEVVIGRTDVASVVLYRPGQTLLDTEVVLVREVRIPARTADGMVHELPGGSAWDGEEPAESVARHEVEEETGFLPGALRVLDGRQIAPTLLAHQAALFAQEISEADVAAIRAGEGEARGLAEDGERTYTEVRTVRELLADDRVDWSTLGMILAAVTRAFEGQRA
ncbi:MAG: nucleoside 2-deoxyribosyltransferase domain-containing protein [Byssovorax sp.]